MSAFRESCCCLFLAADIKAHPLQWQRPVKAAAAPVWLKRRLLLSCRADGYGYTLYLKLLRIPQFCKWFFFFVYYCSGHFTKRLSSETVIKITHGSFKGLPFAVGKIRMIQCMSMGARNYFSFIQNEFEIPWPCKASILANTPKGKLFVHISKNADAKNIVYLN